eukprot:1161462-Pelagomonas_calceolata.AAC.2
MERQTLDTIEELHERESQKSGSQNAQPSLRGSYASNLDKLGVQGHSTDRLDTLQEHRRGSTAASGTPFWIVCLLACMLACVLAGLLVCVRACWLACMHVCVCALQ